jgi:glycosyltransferase involved in cell wall biosynthesis
MEFKVLHISYSDAQGGACRAAYRIHRSLAQTGVDSEMLVNVTESNDPCVEGPLGGWRDWLVRHGYPRVSNAVLKTLVTQNSILHSTSLLPTNLLKRINRSDADIVNLHWVQGDTLSIADIGRINKPIVWTLHDMWPFCGAEHYTMEFRWKQGYQKNNRPLYESGFDLNRWTWLRKQTHWRIPINIVAPSYWLYKCAKNSALMRDWPCDLIPYPIDIEVWRPIEKHQARNLLNLPRDSPLVLFGATGGTIDPRKGFDLLVEAIGHLVDQVPALELVIFGQNAKSGEPKFDFPTHYIGSLKDDLSLRVLYSAADVFALPSRQDNHPLTCMESLSCGTPVVAFNASGQGGMIQHLETGYLAAAFDTKEFARGIQWVLEGSDEKKVRRSSREYAERFYSPQIISERYQEVYSRVLSCEKSRRVEF